MHQQDKVSTTDPDATYVSKGNRRWRGWDITTTISIDNDSCVMVGVQATAARLSQESAAARDMIEGYRERYGRLPQSLAADNTYGNGELLQWLDGSRDHTVHPCERMSDANPRSVRNREVHLCAGRELLRLSEGKPLKYVGINKLNRTHTLPFHG